MLLSHLVDIKKFSQYSIAVSSEISIRNKMACLQSSPSTYPGVYTIHIMNSLLRNNFKMFEEAIRHCLGKYTLLIYLKSIMRNNDSMHTYKK